MMRKSMFTIDSYPSAYIGYTAGKRWNGWATPYFEKDEALRVAEGFNECAENPMLYDAVYDQFYILDKETAELEVWKGKDHTTTEGIKHLYGIGAYSWVWDEERSRWAVDRVAELCEWLGLELDEDELAEKLQDFNTFKNTLIILRSDDKAEIQIQKLRGELQW